MNTKGLAREFKLRGRRTNTKEFITGYGVVESDNKVFMKTENGTYEVEPSSVGQYVGILDNNLEEVYEGDTLIFKTFLSSSWQEGRVVYDDCMFKVGGVPLGDMTKKFVAENQ